MKRNLNLLGLSLFLTATSWAQPLIDIDFGAGSSGKTGFAATGVSTNDYWNFYNRDDGNGGWQVNGALPNLKYVDGTVSGAGLTVNNGPGAWGNGSTDPMYNSYIYPFGGNLVASLTNLPAGSYDVYVYSQDGNYTLNVGATSYGTQTTRESPVVNPPVWQEGKQYALFHSVSVGAGQTLTLTVAPGLDGYAIIAGMQIAPPTVATGTPPSIITQPQSQTAVIGSSVSFSVAASGTSPLSYQWSHDGSAIAGATGSTLSLSGVQTNDAGAYAVVVANAYGSAMSSNAFLTVTGTPPSIITQPQSRTAVIGGSVSFSVAASGTAPLSYQWSHDGSAIAGATGSTLTLSGLQDSDAGAYSVVVSNAYGSVTSADAILTLQSAGTFSLLDIDFGAGTKVQKTGFAATGVSTNDYWNFYTRDDGNGGWRTDGALPNLKYVDGTVSGAGLIVNNGPGAWDNGSTDAMYNDYIYPFGGSLVASVTNLPAGSYDVYVYSQDGNYTLNVGTTSYGTQTTSDEALVNPPVWEEGKQYALFHSVSVGAGDTLSVTVAPGVHGYAIISGMQIAPPTVATGRPPSIITQPQSQTAVIGGGVSFSVTASGTAPLSYQWNHDGSAIAGATNSLLSLSGVQTNDAGAYSVVVANAYGSATSSNAFLTVTGGTPPSIITQPQSRTVAIGSNVTFRVTASGTAPLSYQWSHDGSAILGATNSFLSLRSVQNSDAGAYSVLVANAFGSATSSNALLTVTGATPPSIITQPQSQTAVIGGGVSFSVVATGTAPLSYQWSHDGSAIAGATGSTLTLGGLQNSDAGAYSVVVSNAYGSATSADAILTLQNAGTFSLLDIDFGAGTKVQKTGFAATGVSTNDYWNFYTRDDGNGGWNVNGALLNLKYVDGTVSGAGLTVNNGPGAWGNGSTDAMYNDYIYPFASNLVASVTNLPVGSYDVYVYSQDGNYTLNVGGTSYGTQTTLDEPLVNPPVWEDGKQYVLFHSVSVGAGEALTLTVSNGVHGYAIISGMQIAPPTVATGMPPSIITQPQSRTAVIGGGVSFSVTASGTAPLSHQWSHDGSAIAGATGSTLTLSGLQDSDAGAYSVVVSNAYGSATSADAILTLQNAGTFSLLDIDFGAGTKVQKTGFAATGVSTNDYWNFYTRDDGNGGWNVNGALLNLKYVDGTVSGAGLTVNNGPGAWGNGSTDAMYNDYIYPFGGNLVASVTNLPAGSYDVYVYSSDGNYTLSVGATSYGTQTTSDEALVNPPVWEEGKQYALFHSVSVGAGDTLSLTVAPGVHGYAIISGMQIAPNGLNRPPSPNTVSLGTFQNKPITVPFQKLMSSTTDSDGDAVSLSGIKTNSATGAIIVLAQGSATYVPNTNFMGVDYFTYTVTDAKGAKSLGYVVVDVRPANVASGQMLLPVPVAAGGFNVSFMGVPGRTYNLQRSTSLNGPWINLGPITVDLSGVGVFRDADAPKTGAFYRTVSQ